MKGTGATSAAHLDLDGDGEVDTRIQIVQFNESGRYGSGGKLFSTSKPGFSISITAIKPRSKGSIKIDVEFTLHDEDSKEKIEATKRNLMVFDNSWEMLVKTASNIIEKTLWSREEEERQAAQGDQQKLSALLGSPRPQAPQPTMFPEPPKQLTPEQQKMADFRDKLAGRGKYAKTPEASS